MDITSSGADFRSLHLTQRYSYEKECQALQKDSKAYWDAMKCEHTLACVTGMVLTLGIKAMTSTQARIADTIEIFYGAADKNSDGGMAGHAYKRSVDDLDSSFTRELVRNALHLLPEASC